METLIEGLKKRAGLIKDAIDIGGSIGRVFDHLANSTNLEELSKNVSMLSRLMESRVEIDKKIMENIKETGKLGMTDDLDKLIANSSMNRSMVDTFTKVFLESILRTLRDNGDKENFWKEMMVKSALMLVIQGQEKVEQYTRFLEQFRTRDDFPVTEISRELAAILKPEESECDHTHHVKIVARKPDESIGKTVYDGPIKFNPPEPKKAMLVDGRCTNCGKKIYNDEAKMCPYCDNSF